MSQCNQILIHLKSGKSITQAEAVTKYGIYRLSARIYDLIYKGHAINSERVVINDKHFARYSL